MHGKQKYFKDGLRRRKYAHLEDVDTQWTVHVRATNTHLRILVSALSTQIKNLRTSGRYIHVIVGGFYCMYEQQKLRMRSLARALAAHFLNITIHFRSGQWLYCMCEQLMPIFVVSRLFALLIEKRTRHRPVGSNYRLVGHTLQIGGGGHAYFFLICLI